MDEVFEIDARVTRDRCQALMPNERPHIARVRSAFIEEQPRDRYSVQGEPLRRML
jgi:hypothetical protein